MRISDWSSDVCSSDLPKNGQKFIGKPGVVLSGAKILDNWKPLGATWAVSGLPEPLHRSGECDEGFELCSYREDLFVDGKLLQRVASLSRSDERRVGKGCGRTCSSWRRPDH